MRREENQDSKGGGTRESKKKAEFPEPWNLIAGVKSCVRVPNGFLLHPLFLEVPLSARSFSFCVVPDPLPEFQRQSSGVAGWCVSALQLPPPVSMEPRISRCAIVQDRGVYRWGDNQCIPQDFLSLHSTPTCTLQLQRRSRSRNKTKTNTILS